MVSMAPSAKADKKKKDKSGGNKENDQRPIICCVPEEKVYCSKPEITDQGSVVKVICSSGKCPKSGLMHLECFDKWEDLIVGFLAKQGRGRTWSDKQRYANVWANKGYDLVFKTCACDCGHGSLRKDQDFVAAGGAEGGGAGVAGAAAAPAQAQPDVFDKKKKKKEKTSLKPKLNFSVLNVSGSYFGSIKQKEDEQDSENKWTKDPLPARVVSHRLSSEKSDSPSPVPFIPGLNPPPLNNTALSSNPTKFKADIDRFEKASSAPPQNPSEDGWVTVPSKLGNNRRNSQQSLKLKRKNSVETIKAHVLDVDNKNNNIGDVKPANTISPIPPYNLEVHDPELLKKLRKKPQAGFPSSAPGGQSFPSLPMYQPPPSDKIYFESTLKYERNDSLEQKALNQNQNFFNQEFKAQPNSMAFPQYFGARPKFSPTSIVNEFSKSSEEIYQSDEDISFEELDKTIEKLVEGSPCETPKWSATPNKSPTLNPDKEMNLLWEQTKDFEMELNSLKANPNAIPVSSFKPNPSYRTENNSIPETDSGVSSDGKRDKNGFIHCSSCKTVHTSLTDFTQHCLSDKHRDNAVWAKKLENADIKADLTSGWENFGKERIVDSWEERFDTCDTSLLINENPPAVVQHLGKSPASAFEEVKRRALRRDVDAKSAINEVKKQVMSKKKSKTNSRTSTPDFTVEIENLRKELNAEKEGRKKALAENEALKSEIMAENEARKRTLEELQILRSSKKSIEKQAVIVENTLKLETSEKMRFEKLLDNSKGLVLKRDEEINDLKNEKEEQKVNTAAAKESDFDIKSVENELKETKELLSQEQQKSEANTKLMKKLKEKSEKSLQREKDSRLLAEKTAELAEKQLASVEQKNTNLDNQLKKEVAKVKVAEAKMKDEARKRIVAELELVDQQKKFNDISDKFVKQAAVLNEEKNELAKAVNGLVKDKEVLDDKVSKARAAATERLQDFVNEETCKKILEDSEEIVKQSFLKAIDSKEEFDCFDDVKKIFNMVKDVVQSPENSQNILKSPVKFDVQKVKTEMKEYLKTQNEVTEKSFKVLFDGLVQEGLDKNDGAGIIDRDTNKNERIVNIESDDDEQTETCKDDQTVLLEDDVILDELKDVHKKQYSQPPAETEEKIAESGNSVFDLFDEVLGRKTQEIEEGDDGWEMFEDELNVDGSLLEQSNSDELIEKAMNVEMTKEVKSTALKDDVIKNINEFLKDDVLKNCLNSIFKDSGIHEIEEENKKDVEEENNYVKRDPPTKDYIAKQLKKLGRRGRLRRGKKEDVMDIKEMRIDLEDDDDDSLPGLDRYPKLGLDDEIDPYLGVDEPGEFDDYEADSDSGDDHKQPQPLDYDKYDLMGCPCKGEHNPNGSCKVSAVVPNTDPLRFPFFGEYLLEQDKEPINKQITSEELVAQWNKYMDPNYDPNLDEEIALPKPKSHLPPLLSRLSTCSLPPLPTNSSDTADPTDNVMTRRFSSSISPDSTSGPTDENFSSSTGNSTPPVSASPPQSEAPSSGCNQKLAAPSQPASFQEASRLSTLEQSVSVLQSLMNTMGTQVTHLTTQLEDSNFQSGLLTRTVEKMQDKNCQLQRTVDNLQERNSMLERRVSGNVIDLASDLPPSSSSAEVTDVKENLLELLASCESFQKGFDTMTERQSELESKLKTVTNNYDKSKAENKELRKEFAQLNDKFSSLSLEYQVDKGQMKAQLDSLGYNMAILTAKIPAESFSSTSGVRSGDISENEEGMEKVDKNDGISPLPPLDSLKEIVSAVVFSREEPSSTEADSSTSSVKAVPTSSTTALTMTSSTSSVTKMKKFVYSSSAVNQAVFPHPSPPVVGGPVWMSPDGSMVAVPPNGVPTGPPTSTHPTLPIPTAARSLYGAVNARGSISQMGMAQPYMNQQGGMVYPFNYSMLGPNMFYHR